MTDAESTSAALRRVEQERDQAVKLRFKAEAAAGRLVDERDEARDLARRLRDQLGFADSRIRTLGRELDAVRTARDTLDRARSWVVARDDGYDCSRCHDPIRRGEAYELLPGADTYGHIHCRRSPSMPETPANIARAAENFDPIEVVHAGERCAVDWDPWMGDWLSSSSPRNGNSNAEGQWDHWVDLAVGILKDPLTAIVRPDAHAAAAELTTQGFYDGANRELADDELNARFGKAATDG